MKELPKQNGNIDLELIFQKIPLVEKLNANQRKKLIENTRLILLEKKEFLIHENDSSNSFYVVYSGRFVVFKELEDGSKNILGYLFHGDIIGEISLLTNNKRFASVKAVRQSIVLKFENKVFQEIMQENARLSIKVCEEVVHRLIRSFERNKDVDKHFINIVIISNGQRQIDIDFCKELFLSISKYKTVLQVTQSYLENKGAFLRADDRGRGYLSNLRAFLEIEYEYEVLFFNCDENNFLWDSFAVQHADLIILFFNESDQCPSSQLSDFILKNKKQFSETKKYLVLHHEDKKTHYPDIQRWKNFAKFDLIHHVIHQDKNSVHRIARFITNNHVGLVLSGGGINGFSHIGVMKAIEEFGINVDVFGGVSAGATMACLFAIGIHSDDKIFNEIFYQKNFILNACQLPLASLINPNFQRKNFEKIIKNFFGGVGVEIESLRQKYFALACNLMTMEDKVFFEGPVVDALMASNAMPGIVSPVLFDGQLYIDGGATNTMPVDVMQTIYGGSAIGVNITKERGISIDSHFNSFPSSREIIINRLNPFSTKYKVPLINEILNRSLVIGNKRQLNEMKKLADLYIEPKFPQKPCTLIELINISYIAACEKLKTWKR